MTTFSDDGGIGLIYPRLFNYVFGKTTASSSIGAATGSSQTHSFAAITYAPGTVVGRSDWPWGHCKLVAIMRSGEGRAEIADD